MSRPLFFSAKLRVIFGTRSILPSFSKDRLPYHNKSLPIYKFKFKCQCEAEYIGQTSLRLESRISQHVPKYIRLNSCDHSRVSQSADESSIGQHQLDNESCSSRFLTDSFSILHTGRSKTPFINFGSFMLKIIPACTMQAEGESFKVLEFIRRYVSLIFSFLGSTGSISFFIYGF